MGRNVLAGRNQWAVASRLAVLADKVLHSTGFVRLFRQDYVCSNLAILEFNETAFGSDETAVVVPARSTHTDSHAESPRPWQ